MVEYMVKEGVWKEVQPEFPRRFLPVLTVIGLSHKITKIRVRLDAKNKFKGECK